MHRTARSLSLPLTLGLVLTLPLIGCSNSGGGGGGTGGKASGGSGGNGSGGSNNGGNSGNGGSSAKGGSSGTGGSGQGGTTAKGGAGGGSGGSAGAGGTTAKGGAGGGSGGSSSGGSGGGSTAKGGAGGGSGGSAGAGGSGPGGTGVGGSAPGGAGAGGTGVGGSAPGGAGGTSSGTGDMISDFESTPGKADMDPNGGRTGYWYVYFPSSDTLTTPASGMSISPALSSGAAVATAKDGTNNALHLTGSGFNGSSTNYAGAGAAFKPHTPYDKASDAYDVSKYTGISFKLKSGTGTLPPVFFEMLTKENQPTGSGGTLNSASGSSDTNIGLYNTRGQMLYTPWTPMAISSSWQTFNVPFGTLIPRHLCDASTCPAAGSGVAKCQPPAFVPTDVLGIQLSFYAGEKGWPTISGATPGTFDVWIDDVAFTTDDSNLQTRTGFPRATPVSMGSCKMPVGPSADAKFLVPAYNQWKSTMVSGNKVIRPENGNDTVSEGIAYGMLIAVNMNDQTLFDSLYGYWKSNSATGSLMTWCIPAGSGSCTASGGSATDADEDAAFALLQADKAWGGTYKSDAMKMIGDIWSKDIDSGASGTKLPKGGSNYGAPTGTSGTGITNPSYFAPAYYTAFKAAGDSNDWASVNSAVYTALGKLAGSNGLVPAWCGSSCTAPASNGGANDQIYQYDSHRVPMRIGLDYCFNATPEAKTYVGKTTTFFATNAFAGKDGVSRIYDIYNLNGSQLTSTPNNSASIVGTAAVGAMADGTQQTFINDAYQAVFDLVTRGAMDTTDTSAGAKTPYSYYNATVGMLTLLMMTGNFSH